MVIFGNFARIVKAGNGMGMKRRNPIFVPSLK